MGNYLDISEIEWPEGLSEEQKEYRLRIAEDLFEKVMGRPWRLAEFEIYISGNGKRRIFLGLGAPIIEINEVEIDKEEYSIENFSFDRFSLFFSQESLGCFSKGVRNIRVKGKYGESEVPGWAKEAVRILVKWLNDSGSVERYIRGSESIGDYSYSIDEIISGIREFDELVRNYRRVRLRLGS